jgi:preprotein translocase subunit YajC
MLDGLNLESLNGILPFALIFVAFYFLLIRPQQKRAQDLKRMVESVRRGDTIVTAGGMLGKVTKVFEDGTAQVEIAENVRVRVVRSTIAEVRTKGDPVREGTNKTEVTPANDTKAGDAASSATAGKKTGLSSILGSVFKK